MCSFLSEFLRNTAYLIAGLQYQGWFQNQLSIQFILEAFVVFKRKHQFAFDPKLYSHSLNESLRLSSRQFREEIQVHSVLFSRVSQYLCAVFSPNLSSVFSSQSQVYNCPVIQKLWYFIIFLFLDLKMTIFVFIVFRDYLLGPIEQLVLGLY